MTSERPGQWWIVFTKDNEDAQRAATRVEHDGQRTTIDLLDPVDLETGTYGVYLEDPDGNRRSISWPMDDRVSIFSAAGSYLARPT